MAACFLQPVAKRGLILTGAVPHLDMSSTDMWPTERAVRQNTKNKRFSSGPAPMCEGCEDKEGEPEPAGDEQHQDRPRRRPERPCMWVLVGSCLLVRTASEEAKRWRQGQAKPCGEAKATATVHGMQPLTLSVLVHPHAALPHLQPTVQYVV